MKKKITLRDIGNFFRQSLPEVTWVTMDLDGVHVYDNRGELPPSYNKKKNEWEYDGGTIATVSISLAYIITRPYSSHGDILLEKCIECIDPTLLGKLNETKKKHARHKKKVLAYFADGSTVLFDSKLEAKEFFGLKRIEQITGYINTGNPLPDGSTTLDEALDDKQEAKEKRGRPPKPIPQRRGRISN